MGTAMSTPSLLIAHNNAGQDICLLSRYTNRHGLISGATGTGKTVTLQKIAESLSQAGVPVFMADVKGDLSGIGAPAQPNDKLLQRLAALGITDFQPQACPVTLWDAFGEQGLPLCATISSMGPLLLARLLDLNDTQTGVLHLIFKIADDQGMLLLDLKDLRSMTQHAGEHAKTYTTQYGLISAASIGAVQRRLLVLEEQGGALFFGEPALAIADLIRQDAQGRGQVNILAADKLMQKPVLYSTWLLWMLSELYETLPEVGDLPQPKLVFFFDEAHLLFNNAPAALLDKIEQVVRLIRSKGVGIFFISQLPSDLPDAILGQLGNRVQHALRAYTPRDQKALKAAASTMRANPALDSEQAIAELGTGEALVSFLDEAGRPSMVEQASVIAPQSRMGPLTTTERQTLWQGSPLHARYSQALDRESAYEILLERAQQTQNTPGSTTQDKSVDFKDIASDLLFGSTGPRGGKKDGLVQVAAKTATRTIGNSLGRQIVRGILGSLFGGNKKN